MASKAKQTLAEKINQRRHQVLIHSILYYRFDASYVRDADYDRWSQELVALQDENPDISETVPYHLEAFRGYTGDTGYHLPLTDVYAVRKAKQLLHRRENP